MPYSDGQGKDWLLTRILDHAPASVLDIGVGAGTYANLLRPKLPELHMTGIEVFEDYVPMFNLTALYDHLILADARDVEWPEADVVIMGDVVEHMPKEDALDVWVKARKAARKAVFVSVPIIVAHQGAEFGNEYERHLHHWTHGEMMNMPGVVKYWTGPILGCYEVSPT